MANEPILIVDDNATNIKLTKLLLSTAGYEVRTAGDAKEAFEVLASFRQHLILMDIQMPGMDGLELTRRLKADPVNRDTFIVGLSSFAMATDQEKAKEAGCDSFVTKPCLPDALVAEIQRMLEGKGRKTKAKEKR